MADGFGFYVQASCTFLGPDIAPAISTVSFLPFPHMQSCISVFLQLFYKSSAFIFKPSLIYSHYILPIFFLLFYLQYSHFHISTPFSVSVQGKPCVQSISGWWSFIYSIFCLLSILLTCHYEYPLPSEYYLKYIYTQTQLMLTEVLDYF